MNAFTKRLATISTLIDPKGAMPGSKKAVQAVGYRVGKGQEWSNPSVLRFAHDRDPVEVVLERARQVTMQAVDNGWTGPPFDPFKLAALLDIQINASGSVQEAQVAVDDDGKFAVDLNPTRPRVRQRFSLAHEIAHTLFPDCGESIRRRLLHADASASEWELEALCNIAAAEFLMPLGSMPEIREYGSIDEALSLRKQYEVSAEAILIRTVQLARKPLAMFSASRIESDGQNRDRYRLDYLIESLAWDGPEMQAATLIAPDSAIAECTAIGYTRKGRAGFGSDDLYVECVGVTAYGDRSYPRVVGFVKRMDGADAQTTKAITYLRGDALDPRPGARRIIAFMTNDVTARWGGGFARQVALNFPNVQLDFEQRAMNDPATLELGAVTLLEATENLYFAPIVAQHGLGEAKLPKIRYKALETAMLSLASKAAELDASVHMPRIGAGGSGGNWEVIREMIEEHVCGLTDVYIYDLPGRPQRQLTNRPNSLRLFSGVN